MPFSSVQMPCKVVYPQMIFLSLTWKTGYAKKKKKYNAVFWFAHKIPSEVRVSTGWKHNSTIPPLLPLPPLFSLITWSQRSQNKCTVAWAMINTPCFFRTFFFSSCPTHAELVVLTFSELMACLLSSEEVDLPPHLSLLRLLLKIVLFSEYFLVTETQFCTEMAVLY